MPSKRTKSSYSSKFRFFIVGEINKQIPGSLGVAFETWCVEFSLLWKHSRRPINYDANEVNFLKFASQHKKMKISWQKSANSLQFSSASNIHTLCISQSLRRRKKIIWIMAHESECNIKRDEQHARVNFSKRYIFMSVAVFTVKAIRCIPAECASGTRWIMTRLISIPFFLDGSINSIQRA